MGRFDSTCGLSRTAIHPGQRVLLIHTTMRPRGAPGSDAYRPAAAHTDALASQTALYLHAAQQRRTGDAPVTPPYQAIPGRYDGAGWLTTEDGQPYRSGQHRHMDSVSQDDYGDERLPPEHYCFIKHSVLSTLFPRRTLATEAEAQTLLADLAAFAHRTRVQLFGNTHNLLGTQYADAHELQQQQALHTAIGAELERMSPDVNTP